jgi:tungstate transport system ATP-binding protein
MMDILKIDNLTKAYNGKTVLNIPKLSIEAGKITAIIGPSGAGKSTLLTLINGIEKPDTGCIYFEDEEYSRNKTCSPAAIRRMAMVFQKPVMFNTTVYNNIAYGLKVRRLNKSDISLRLRDAAAFLGLSDLLEQKAITLSGGEAGRVSVARAMILKPDLLLMDEPTANLDPANVAIIEDMIIKASRVYRTTVVVVTHNMFQAKRLADNIVFMLNGQIVEEGSGSAVFQDPKDQRTQAFTTGNMIY